MLVIPDKRKMDWIMLQQVKSFFTVFNQPHSGGQVQGSQVWSVMMFVQIYERPMISAVQMNQVYNNSISASTGNSVEVWVT